MEFYSVSISGSSATLTADLIKKRTLTTAQIVDKWNEIAAGMTDMDVTVTSSGSSMSSMMSTSSYEIDLQGNDRQNWHRPQKTCRQRSRRLTVS